MNDEKLLNEFSDIVVWSNGVQRAPHKPLLILYALGSLQNGKNKVLFTDLEKPVTKLLKKYGPSRQSYHPEYPFWRLQNDRIWVLENAEKCETREGNTDAKVSELRKNQVRGYFRPDIQAVLRADKVLFAKVVEMVLDNTFPDSLHTEILEDCGIQLEDGKTDEGRDSERERRMRLRKALSMLSKSSPYAVSTVGENIDPRLEDIKQYLYVETDIEKAFRNKLDNIGSHEIVFLCGSSGDGKSEILTRHRKEYEAKVDFHLDATHSFKPDATAIETLDTMFSSFTDSDKPLVVGINIGMLGNYEREGDDTHASIRAAIYRFLNNEPVVGDYTFIDFEAFPKFKIVEGEVRSEFFSSLLRKVVADDSRNPFRDIFNDEMSAGNDRKLVANYLLLRERSIQKTIIELLLCARIRRDQFITARMLLDFIYCILTGPGYLFENMFAGGENELLTAIANFDPSIIRNKDLDLFVIHRALGFKDENYNEFIGEIAAKYRVVDELSPESLVKLFYLLKSTNLDNNYHFKYKKSFDEAPLDLYKKIWQLHRDYDGSSEGKSKLKPFYNEVVLVALNKYANRNAPYLTKDEFYISSHGESDLAAEVEISIVYSRIKNDDFHDISEFNLHLDVNDEQLPPVPVNVNLLSMMMDIVNGFRPNRHNKNSVVLLDELVGKITRHASNSKVLFLHRNGDRIKLKENSDGDIRVSGL